MPVHATGTALDAGLSGLIDRLVAFEQVPITHAKQRQEAIQVKIDAYASLRGTLSNLDAALTALTSAFTGGDPTEIQDALDGFVSAYNANIANMNALQRRSEQTGKTGPLIGDAVLRRIYEMLQSIVRGFTPGITFGSLSAIGITTGTGGALSADSTKLEGALAANLSGVRDLFDRLSGGGRTGIATQMLSAIDSILDVVNGTLSLRESGYQASIRSIDQRVVREEGRVTRFRQRVTTRFEALQTLLGRLQTTQQLVSSSIFQLNNLSTFLSHGPSGQSSNAAG